MQMQELESTAQETPSPAASRGHQLALSPSVVPWGLARLSTEGTHSLALRDGCAATRSSWKTLEMETPRGEGKKKNPNPHLENRLSHTM